MNRLQAETFIDVNVDLSRWPTRRSPDDETPRLVDRLAALGVVEAWAGTFDGIFHKNVAAANRRLADECSQYTAVRLLPFGSINPMLPEWEEDLRRCSEEHGMLGLRLHPNYHGYGLDSPLFARVLELALERKMMIQLAVSMEDPRMMHPLLRVPVVDLSPLPQLLPNYPGQRLLLLNALKAITGDELSTLLRLDGVYAEISMLEGMHALESLLSRVSHERILFGSHAPSLYMESARLKLQESELAGFQRRAIAHDNADQLRTGANDES